MPSIQLLSLTLVVLGLYAGGALAFGAGEIPGYGVLSGKAFRHGDIENTLATMLIRVTAGSHGGANAVFGFVKKLTGMEGENFGSLNVKRTYFGNWLYPPLSPLFLTAPFERSCLRHRILVDVVGEIIRRLWMWGLFRRVLTSI